MYLSEVIYEKFLMEELDFQGTWKEFVSSYVTIKTVEPFKARWVPSAGEVKRQNSWLELSLELRLDAQSKSRRFGGSLIHEAERIMKGLIQYQTFSFEFSPLPATELKIGGEYWYNPKNPTQKGRPVIIKKISGINVEYHDSVPIRTRINRRGREVVEFDPSTIRSFADTSEIHEITFDPRELRERQQKTWVKDCPSATQLSCGFDGPVEGVDLSEFTIPSSLSDSQVSFIAGHVLGWKKCGASHAEIQFMASWLSNNLKELRHEYFDASDYAPSPLFSGAAN